MNIKLTKQQKAAGITVESIAKLFKTNVTIKDATEFPRGNPRPSDRPSRQGRKGKAQPERCICEAPCRWRPPRTCRNCKVALRIELPAEVQWGRAGCPECGDSWLWHPNYRCELGSADILKRFKDSHKKRVLRPNEEFGCVQLDPPTPRSDKQIARAEAIKRDVAKTESKLVGRSDIDVYGNPLVVAPRERETQEDLTWDEYDLSPQGSQWSLPIKWPQDEDEYEEDEYGLPIRKEKLPEWHGVDEHGLPITPLRDIVAQSMTNIHITATKAKWFPAPGRESPLSDRPEVEDGASPTVSRWSVVDDLSDPNSEECHQDREGDASIEPVEEPEAEILATGFAPREQLTAPEPPIEMARPIKTPHVTVHLNHEFDSHDIMPLEEEVDQDIMVVPVHQNQLAIGERWRQRENIVVDKGLYGHLSLLRVSRGPTAAMRTALADHGRRWMSEFRPTWSDIEKRDQLQRAITAALLETPAEQRTRQLLKGRDAQLGLKRSYDTTKGDLGTVGIPLLGRWFGRKAVLPGNQ